MGCTPSGSVHTSPRENRANPETLQRYLQLEEDIWREEKSFPAPTLNRILVRLEASGIELTTAEERLSRFTRSGGTDESLREVLLELEIDNDPIRAQEHEEFIANINRQVLAQNEVAFLRRRVEELEEEANIVNAKVNYLQGLYQKQDELLGEFFGETYGSEEEKQLELELDKLRSYRDVLAGGDLEWKDAIYQVTLASELLERALHSWNNQAKFQITEHRLDTVIEMRNCVQEASLFIQSAQAMLPGVQFPYCSPRELKSVLQAIVYIFTDIHEPERKEHALKCYNHFYERTKALNIWMDQTRKETLQKDLDDIDLNVKKATTNLKSVRTALIHSKMGPEFQYRGLEGGHLQNYHTVGAPRVPFMRRLSHSALFATRDPEKNNLYGPSTSIKNNSKTPSLKLQEEFQDKIKSRRELWTSKKLEEEVHYWRSGSGTQGDNSTAMPQRLPNY